MYCPKCLSSSLHMSERGVVHIIINGRQMDTGRFLFNQERQTAEEISQELKKKFEEFFAWYVTFQNKSAIKSVEVCSSDFLCQNACKIDMKYKFSVVDELISKHTLKQIISDLCAKYQIKCELEF